MCGIAGIFSFHSQADKQRCKNMTDILAHRGPDGEGLWVNENNNLCLGHRRLSIVDLSLNGAQPMHYMERYTITYNGEIYNFRSLREDLLKKGFSFRSDTDTEILLALYHLHGTRCLDVIDGMFAFAIWDKKEQTLFCARDRFGEKPFYYHYNSREFVFGSEIKAILAAGIPKKVNTRRLIRQLVNNEIEDTQDKSTTFFEGINSLESSHYLLIRSTGEITEKKYYDLHFSEKPISLKDAREEFRHLMKSSVSLRTSTSDVPVGTSLSGGVDSSIIFHELNSIHQNTKSFTASFPGFIKDETKLVKLLHKNYNSLAAFIEPSAEDYLEQLDVFCFHQDEPVGNANHFAQWSVYSLAKKNDVTVLLDGQGADEVFAGYHLYFRPFLQKKFVTNPAGFGKIASKYKHSAHLSLDKHFYAEAMFPGAYHKFTNLRKYYRSHLSDLTPDFLSENEKHLINSQFLRPDVNAHQKYNLFSSGLEQLLRYGDRSSMAHSLEVRLPFLSRDLVEFSASLPVDHRIHDGYSKYIERIAYDKVIPDEIIWKKDKIGYEAPQEKWYESDAMQEKIRDSIALLQRENIISENYNISKWWQYIQAAKLFS